MPPAAGSRGADVSLMYNTDRSTLRKSAPIALRGACMLHACFLFVSPMNGRPSNAREDLSA